MPLAALAALSGGCGSNPGTAAGGGIPCSDCNLVLISLDTLRADRLSLYGYERPTSPNLERLAADAVVFETFVSEHGGTLPIHVSMLTSLPVAVHKITPKSGAVLQPERVTLAERLRDSGRRTAAITDAGWMRGRFGFKQGFESYDDAGGGFEKILPKSLKWLETQRDDPFFLFLHSYDVHSRRSGQPYDCPDGHGDRYTAGDRGDHGCGGERCAPGQLAWLNKQARAGVEGFAIGDYLDAADLQFMSDRYDGCIHYVDDVVQKIVDALRRLGIYDRTVIVVTSDHGEEFLEHGLLLHSNLPYEELLRVPMLLKLPYSAYAGTRVDGPAAMIDLMPTLLEVLGISPGSQEVGLNLLPQIAGEREVRRVAHFAATSVRTSRWKLMKGHQLLYDLLADPGETENRAAAEPEVLAELKAAAEEVIKRNRELAEQFEASAGAGEEWVLEPEVVEGLSALGYLGDLARPSHQGP